MATNVVLPMSVAGNGQKRIGYERQLSHGKLHQGKPQHSQDHGVTRLARGRQHQSRSGDIIDKKRTMITEIDPSSYRNSIFHNICNEMLEKGFHQSFAELFKLVEQQRLEHERAGPAAILLEPLIDSDHTKLERLRVQLTAAEDARRSGDLDTVYLCQRNMAQYFEQTGDTWLADHLYHRCLETGSMVEGDNRRKEGEAHCHVGLTLENRGNLDKASMHMATFHQLARKHKWHTESGDSLHEIACEHLRRIYTSFAEQTNAEDPMTAITYLKKAHDIAKEGGDSYQEGLACYRLGNAFEGIGEHDTAIQYHKKYLEHCKYHSDNEGIGNAYEALSRSYESKGDLESAVKYLEMYVSVAEKAGLKKSLAKACSAVGSMYSTLNDYNKAVAFFGRCYEICSELNDTEALRSARVQYGIARGNQLVGDFSSQFNEGTVHSLQQLVLWKDARTVPSFEEECGDFENSGQGGGDSEYVEQQDESHGASQPQERNSNDPENTVAVAVAEDTVKHDETQDT